MIRHAGEWLAGYIEHNQPSSIIERLYGAGMGLLGVLITLSLGGAVGAMIELTLGMGPYGGVVIGKIAPFIPQFCYGIWLIVPAFAFGFAFGFHQTLQAFSYVWGTTFSVRRIQTLSCWVALSAICFCTRWLFA